MDWGDLAKICRKKPKEIRSLTLRIPFSYKESKTSSSRLLTFKNSIRISVNYGVSKSSRRLILKRSTVTGNMSSVSTKTVNVTSKTKGIRKRKRLESDEKLEGERVSHFDEFIFVLFCRIYSSPVMFAQTNHSQVKVAKPVLSSATDAPMESAVVKSKSQTLHSFFSKSKAKKRTADVAKVTNEEKVR